MLNRKVTIALSVVFATCISASQEANPSAHSTPQMQRELPANTTPTTDSQGGRAALKPAESGTSITKSAVELKSNNPMADPDGSFEEGVVEFTADDLKQIEKLNQFQAQTSLDGIPNPTPEKVEETQHVSLPKMPEEMKEEIKRKANEMKKKTEKRKEVMKQTIKRVQPAVTVEGLLDTVDEGDLLKKVQKAIDQIDNWCRENPALRIVSKRRDLSVKEAIINAFYASDNPEQASSEAVEQIDDLKAAIGLSYLYAHYSNNLKNKDIGNSVKYVTLRAFDDDLLCGVCDVVNLKLLIDSMVSDKEINPNE